MIMSRGTGGIRSSALLAMIQRRCRGPRSLTRMDRKRALDRPLMGEAEAEAEDMEAHPEEEAECSVLMIANSVRGRVSTVEDSHENRTGTGTETGSIFHDELRL
jgi:hypothetical protein